MGDLGRALPHVGVDGIEEHAPDVVLVLVPGGIADPHRTRAPVAGEMVEGVLGEITLAIDAVHDLQVEGAITTGHSVEDEGEVLQRLPAETEPVERAQHECRVPDPRVAVVPVAGATRRFGERSRGGRHHGPSGRVAQALERERAPLQVRAPGVVGKLADAQPVSPVGHGGEHVLVDLLLALRQVVRPGQGDERRLAGGQGGPAIAAATDDAQLDPAHQLDDRISRRRLSHRHRVPIAVVSPPSRLGAILEVGHAVDEHFDLLPDTRGHARQGSARRRVPGRPAVVRTALLGAADRSHCHEIGDQQPTGRCMPGGLENHRARNVTTMVGHVDVRRPQAKRPSRSIEERSEDAGRVRSGEAQPFDGPVGGNQAVVLAIGQECVLADRRERVHGKLLARASEACPS